jgi:hypothetical protein
MSDIRISLLLPTRGRPALVARLFNSIVATASCLSRIEVILYVDDDDIGSHQLSSADFRTLLIVGSGMTMGGYNSACLAQAQGDIVMLVNDDMIFGTPGWDDQLIALDAEYPDKIYLAYGNDLNKGRKLCTFPILSRRTCELLVEPYPTAYHGAFIDIHLFDVFKRLHHGGFDRIRYLEDLLVEHLHFRTGKAEPDETYLRRGRFSDDATFINMTGVRSAGVRRLLNVLRGEAEGDYVQKAFDSYAPAGILSALRQLSRQFLSDRELPLGWRAWLWYRFIGRYLAMHGFLWPFVRP